MHARWARSQRAPEASPKRSAIRSPSSNSSSARRRSNAENRVNGHVVGDRTGQRRVCSHGELERTLLVVRASGVAEVALGEPDRGEGVRLELAGSAASPPSSLPRSRVGALPADHPRSPECGRCTRARERRCRRCARRRALLRSPRGASPARSALGATRLATGTALLRRRSLGRRLRAAHRERPRALYRSLVVGDVERFCMP